MRRLLAYAASLALLAGCDEQARTRAPREAVPKPELQIGQPHCPPAIQWRFEEPLGHAETIDIGVDASNRILWGGHPISLSELRRNARLLEGSKPIFMLIVRFAPEADCAVVKEVRNALDPSVNCRIGRCVLGAQWDARGE